MIQSMQARQFLYVFPFCSSLALWLFCYSNSLLISSFGFGSFVVSFRSLFFFVCSQLLSYLLVLILHILYKSQYFVIFGSCYLKQQEGCWMTQDSRITKKCRARPGMHSLVQHFFVIVPFCRVMSLLVRLRNPSYQSPFTVLVRLKGANC